MSLALCKLIEQGAPVDRVFQSIAGTKVANASFGFYLSVLAEAEQAALSLNRSTVGNNVMYFETGTGSALSANAHQGVDQKASEARAYAVARKFNPLWVNTVVGFIGPEYLWPFRRLADHVIASWRIFRYKYSMSLSVDFNILVA